MRDREVDRVVRPRAPRTVDPARGAIKQALWSFHAHAAGYAPSRLPPELRAGPQTQVLEAAAGWQDEHARQRRARLLRRFDPAIHAGFKRGASADELKARMDGYDRPELQRRIARQHTSAPHTAAAYVERTWADMEDPEWRVCLPTADDPNYDPQRGSTRLFSRLIAQRPMDRDLACLLDPRGWDMCSDLFEETCAVEQRNGHYIRVDTRPEEYGTNWEGLLYEFADVGPQAVENILRVRFTVTKACDPLPHWLGRRRQDSARTMGAWRQRRRNEVARCCAVEPCAPCAGGACDHPIDAVEVLYQLYDSLSYRLGALTLPGTMRQNNGFLRARALPNGRTKISCLKRVRFGRLTEWSVAGAFDLGDVLNYVAPTFLSLWVGDVEQIVPCCHQRKAITHTAGAEVS